MCHHVCRHVSSVSLLHQSLRKASWQQSIEGKHIATWYDVWCLHVPSSNYSIFTNCTSLGPEDFLRKNINCYKNIFSKAILDLKRALLQLLLFLRSLKPIELLPSGLMDSSLVSSAKPAMWQVRSRSSFAGPVTVQRWNERLQFGCNSVTGSALSNSLKVRPRCPQILMSNKPRDQETQATSGQEPSRGTFQVPSTCPCTWHFLLDIFTTSLTPIAPPKTKETVERMWTFVKLETS